ncbi:uncharacterized protein [Halyomorpha halys]|uniref:uncharacterized protein isoform X2 n=1 Tax=Halyomorpha halys TaxID=286706 RepID=UPI0006D517EF|nr:uncharacterized protein LOC106678645 isoform X2 [Halyomorpha halys]
MSSRDFASSKMEMKLIAFLLFFGFASAGKLGGYDLTDTEVELDDNIMGGGTKEDVSDELDSTKEGMIITWDSFEPNIYQLKKVTRKIQTNQIPAWKILQLKNATHMFRISLTYLIPVWKTLRSKKVRKMVRISLTYLIPAWKMLLFNKMTKVLWWHLTDLIPAGKILRSKKIRKELWRSLTDLIPALKMCQSKEVIKALWSRLTIPITTWKIKKTKRAKKM